MLHEEVAINITALEAIITQNPKQHIMKVIGNHENFETFRDALTELENKYPNFQWCTEAALIPIAGGKEGKQQTLLAVHGDLQMDDLWFV
jgi:hypothetical protein